MLVVKKFGGTSVGNKDRIMNVAKRCIEDYKKGNPKYYTTYFKAYILYKHGKQRNDTKQLTICYGT